MDTLIVIPARWASSRFPGKPLADILGKPMIQRVYEQASLAHCTNHVVVATDDLRIANAVKKFGGNFLMTSPSHPSGTDRVVEVAEKIKAKIYINVQGDEPLINPEDIDCLAEALHSDTSSEITTLCYKISYEEALNPNNVKLIMTHTGQVLYFSRNPIPYSVNAPQKRDYLKHIGIYAYRASLLDRYKNLPKSDLEASERLEQLRLLQADIPIRSLCTKRTGPSVDTPENLKEVIRILSKQQAEGPMIPSKKTEIRLKAGA